MAKVGAYYYVEAERMSEVRGIISMACMQFRMTMIFISRRHFGCNKQGGNRVPFLYRTAGSAKIDGLSWERDQMAHLSDAIIDDSVRRGETSPQFVYLSM